MNREQGPSGARSLLIILQRSLLCTFNVPKGIHVGASYRLVVTLLIEVFLTGLSHFLSHEKSDLLVTAESEVFKSYHCIVRLILIPTLQRTLQKEHARE